MPFLFCRAIESPCRRRVGYLSQGKLSRASVPDRPVKKTRRKVEVGGDRPRTTKAASQSVILKARVSAAFCLAPPGITSAYHIGCHDNNARLFRAVQGWGGCLFKVTQVIAGYTETCRGERANRRRSERGKHREFQVERGGRRR